MVERRGGRRVISLRNVMKKKYISTSEVETIGVAMSGGVDSSVAAALLKKQGFRVFGLTMKTFCATNFLNTNCTNSVDLCCGEEGILSAKKVCKKLGIPHYTVDISKEFTKKVINDFISEYKSGKTPNPCVRCNQFIKFDLLLKLAQKYGADFLATGHYVRLVQFPKSPDASVGTPTTRRGKFQIPIYHLLRGKDKNKDQSYFLYTLNQNQLSKLIFPLGDLKKEEVRNLARQFKLLTAEKPESQEICFVTTNLYDFLSSRINAKLGDIVAADGKVIGKHRGVAFYTIGQRAGIGGKGPYYIAKIDKKKNQIIVTNNLKNPLILKREIIISGAHWIDQKFAMKTKSRKLKVEIQIRYKSKPVLGKILNLGKNRIKVIFKKPVFAPAPGQSAVFYLKDECLGGGIIEK